MEFKLNKKIDIDHLFQQIGKISTIPARELTPLLDTWSMNLNHRNRTLLGQPSRLVIQEDIKNETQPDRRSISRVLSRKYGLPPSDDLYTVSRRIKLATDQLNDGL